MMLAGTLLSGCVQQHPEEQPMMKTLEDVAVDVVTLLMENNLTNVYDFLTRR